VTGLEGNPDASLAFWVHNTSKKSIVLDLDLPNAQETARKLALGADVVLEDYPVGYLAARGLGYADLHAAKPSLVYTSVTGFGQTGPHAGWAYSDIVGQAMGGIMTLAGEAADPPNMLYGHQADVSASIQAAQGTLIAVLHAEATCQGQLVDVSAQEAVSMSQETAMQTWDFQKRNRARTGELGMLPVKIPGSGTLKVKDGYIVLFVITGASMPLETLALGGVAAVALVFARAGGKMLGVLLVAPFGGLRMVQTAGLGLALLPMSSLTLLLQHDISRLYPEYGLHLQAALVGAIIIMEIVGPVAVEAGLRLAGETAPESGAETRVHAA
jgi:hypothetical protein